MPPFHDRTGERIGRLVVTELAGYRQQRHGRVPLWKCRCDCGTVRTIITSNLKAGHTRSCGCLQRETLAKIRTTHGHTRGHGKTKEYRAYWAMLSRCDNPRVEHYPSYGGRGITVCERWRTGFETFLADMGPCPVAHSLDRIDPNGNYEPSNCRWADWNTQWRNKRKPLLDLTSERFGALTALRFIGYREFPNGAKHRVWECRCDCGRVITQTANMLRGRPNLTCGRGHRRH